MQANDTDLDLAANDLGPLAWVLDELRKSLDSAAGALRRFVRDAGLARGSDMAPVDDGQLRIARQQLHQAVGALEMVGFAAPAHMLRAMESAVQKFVERPELCNEAAAAKIERAGFALTEYLEGVLLGKPVSAVALFPQYRDAQELAGADRIHPADLWAFDWRWVDPDTPSAAESLTYGPVVRGRMDQSVLEVVRGGDVSAAARGLAGLCLSLASGQSSRQPKIFWKISAGYFEALAQGLIAIDIYVKRAASRVLMQYASLARGELGVSDRLAQDLLFFCCQAVPARTTDAPVLSSVRRAWTLARFKPVQYQVTHFGRFDPVLLAQARKRIGVAKEIWSVLSGGDANKLKGVAEQFHLVSDSLVKLHPPSGLLAHALVVAVDAVVRGGHAPRPELAMEVATSVLYLEAAFEDLDPSDSQLAVRTARLAERLDKVRDGGQPEPLELWMEELYRRVSDRQTMGSVVGELRATLSALEKILDNFFRDPKEKVGLLAAPGHLSQMRGVLSVLGLDQAAQAVLHMRGSVEEIIVTEVDEASARATGTFDKLGNNLGALGFLIDMLNYQPALAKKLFVYDEALGELKPLMGRTGNSERDTAAAVTVNDAYLVAAAGIDFVNNSSDDITVKLDIIATQAALAEQAGLAQSARDAASAFASRDEVAAAAALVALAATVPAVIAPPTLPVEDAFEEDDLLDIFLEEAREVVQSGLAAIEALSIHPGDISELTVLRRAFHTLKGSSRMVGLNEFGEAGWSLEQLLNTCMADQKPASDDLLALSGDAMHGFARWVEDIAAHQDGAWKASMFRGPADTLRNENRRVALVLPGLVPPAPVNAGWMAPAAVESAVAVPDAGDTENVIAAKSSAAEDVARKLADDIGEYEPTMLGRPVFDFALPEPAAIEVPSIEPAAVEAVEVVDLFEFPEEFELSGPLADKEPLAQTQSAPSFNATQVLQGQATPAAEVQGAELPADFLPSVEPMTARSGASFGHVQDIAGIDLDRVAFIAGGSFTVEAEGQAELAADIDAQSKIQGAALAGSDAADAVEVHVAASAEAPSEVLDSQFSDERVDEQIKVIGTLQIGIPLYNVYLNEADELSRRLVTEVTEWTLEMNVRVPDSTVGLAHALAGSSATVGFQTLSDIARVLEHSLGKTQSLVHGTPRHAAAFVGAAEEIRRLLHQFAAGFLKEPDPHVVPALLALKDIDVPQRADLPEEELFSDFGQLGSSMPLSATPATGRVEKAIGAVEPHRSEPLTAPVVPVVPVASVSFALPPAALHVAPLDFDGDDDIDIVDAVDFDLFPIFEEEAAELMPVLGGALRNWVTRPDNRAARDEVLRALHTLKGSARLAGALRLGEMTHRLESEIEFLGSENVSAVNIEPLLHRFDNMQGNFDALRATGGQPQVAAEVDTVSGRPAGAVLAAAPDGALRASAAGGGAEAHEVSSAIGSTRIAGIDSLALDSTIGPAAAPVAPAAAKRALLARPVTTILAPQRAAANHAVRVRSQLLDRLVNQAGEVMITRSRLEAELRHLRGSLGDLSSNLDRLRTQLRDIELQAETQMQSRLALSKDSAAGFDPLEFDRFTRVQELTRMMAESVNDVATVQRNLQRTVEATEDDLIAQARQTRELQRDLLRTRMVEFESIADRLYRVVRLASKETGKQVKLDLTGGSIEMDRGVLDRMTPAFEHLLRNSVAHGIEDPAVRVAAGKEAAGVIRIGLHYEGNDVSVEFNDDGAGLNLPRIREKALQQALIKPGQEISDAEAANLIFMPGFSTATLVTELSGRGIGMDVVRSEINALGGRIETTTEAGKGTNFKLVLPLTTAVTQVVMIRSGKLAVGVPANLVEVVRRAPAAEVQQAYSTGFYEVAGQPLPFYWSGALLQASQRSAEPHSKTSPVVIFKSAAQRIAVHVDEVLGNQEVVVKNLGPQLARLPGLAGMTVLASGAVVLIYNPVALSTVYGGQARRLSTDAPRSDATVHGATAFNPDLPAAPVPAAPAQIPLVLVVDDSITVRRVTQRLLQREGYRVTLAADGLQAIERLADEIPTVVLSDIEMPRMDGFDLARNIRADTRLAGLPIIMITSRIAEKHREHAMELGVNNYLGKPYSEEELLSLVKHYCSIAQLAK